MNTKWVGTAAIIVLVLAGASILRTCNKRTPLPSVAAAVKELSDPGDDAEARAAVLAIQSKGEHALEQVRALYHAAAPPPRAAESRAEESDQPPVAATPAEANMAVRRAFAVDLLTSLPATPQVVGAIVDALGRETHPALKAGLADYLRQASGMHLKDPSVDESVTDPGTDAAAWRSWWEREGRNMTSFHPPYGTQPSGTTPPQ
ncbi:MAG: hypothetical protein M3463_08445 [Verrucomicrobiota bacterium]|nr:hypothetical protein [Verrucomicrobiota bacterium]